MKGAARNIKPLQILTDEQVEAINRATLEVLEVTGVRVENERALKVFGDAGCQADHKKMRVRIPGALVEECLRKCPSVFHLKTRDPKNDLTIGGNVTYFCPMPGMEIVDLDTWKSRPPTLKEYDDAVKVLDALDNLHLFTVYTPYFNLQGIPPVMCIPEGVASRIRNSTKSSFTGYQQNCEIFAIEMAKAVGIEMMGMSLASSPLTYYGDAIESLFRFVEAGFPIMVGSGTVIGGTGPATIAGSIITYNSEVIPAVVLAQLIKPGNRVLVAGTARIMNMRTGNPAHGAIGVSLHNVAFGQIWRKYKIPTYGVAVESSSKQIDFQCGYEKAISALLGALSGINVVQLHGGIHGELTFHPVQAVLDDDIAGMIGRFMEGVEVDEDTMAAELIEEVGPIPGFYLSKEHTRKWWKKEQFLPKVADRSNYSEWVKKGKKTALDYAKKRVEEILATHQPAPLPEDQDKEIEKILGKARKYYKEKGLM